MSNFVITIQNCCYGNNFLHPCTYLTCLSPAPHHSPLNAEAEHDHDPCMGVPCRGQNKLSKYMHASNCSCTCVVHHFNWCCFNDIVLLPNHTSCPEPTPWGQNDPLAFICPTQSTHQLSSMLTPNFVSDSMLLIALYSVILYIANHYTNGRLSYWHCISYTAPFNRPPHQKLASV